MSASLAKVLEPSQGWSQPHTLPRGVRLTQYQPPEYNHTLSSRNFDEELGLIYNRQDRGMNPPARISIVIPTHNGAARLAACLQSLRSSSLMPHEIIVVDDASSDASADIAAHYNCCVVRLDENMGAARAKNRGARVATGDILLFTDDDVLLQAGAVARVAHDLEDPRVAGVVGLLARETGLPDFASNFKNLWMRFTYARLPRDRIGVFYTSIAAIRRELFLQLGGFDENYTGASIAEDTEFGQRVWAAGHLLRLDPHIEGTHRKHYTPVQVLKTDFLRARALVLMRLRKWGAQFYTSVPLFYQFAVPLVYATILSLVLGILLNNPVWLFLLVLCLVLLYALHASWLLFLARERGARFALLAALFQPLDVIAVGIGMAAAVLEFIRGKRY